ncbi:MAG: hypothetical protein AAGG01_23275, partial [Planctomycetota bacterium]
LPGLDRKRVHTEAVPLMIQRLEETRDLDLAVGCLLALGKIGEAPRDLARAEGLASVEAAVSARLTDANERVRDASILALGLVGGPRASTTLAEIAAGLPEGRKALGGGRIDSRSRAFGAYALGLIGHHSRRPSERTFVVGQLLDLAFAEARDTELATAAIVSLGWAPLPFEARLEASGSDDVLPQLRGQEATVRRLLQLYFSDETDLRARAQAPAAIARLVLTDPGSATRTPQEVLTIATQREELRREVLRLFTDRLRARGGERNASIREGLAQALGLLTVPSADGVDRDAIEQLIATAQKGQEREAGLALLSLARVATRAGADTETERATVSRGIADELGRTVREGSASARPWATLGLGIYEHGIRLRGGTTPAKYRSELARRFDKAVSPEESGAAAIALGLAADPSLTDKLTRGLVTGAFNVRGQFALSLALTGVTEAIGTLQSVAANTLLAPSLLRDASIALALLRDDSLVELLVSRLAQARLMGERIAALKALAWSSDPTALSALLYVLREPRIGKRRIDDTSRAFAAAALGAIASRRSLPWNAHLALDITWSAAPPTRPGVRDGGGVRDRF